MPVRRIVEQPKQDTKAASKEKIEIDLEDIKKVILILTLSKQHLNVPADNLNLLNMWRVSGKLRDKLLKKSGMQIVEVKGKTILKPLEESTK